jgi:hypothetical protein
MNAFTTKLAGVSFGDHQQNIQLFGYPAELGIEEYELVREPNNEHDPFAVRVCFRNFCLGYLPKNIARKVAPQLDAGTNMVAEFVSVNRSPYHDQVGLTVRIVQVENLNTKIIPLLSCQMYGRGTQNSKKEELCFMTYSIKKEVRLNEIREELKKTK